MEELSEAVDEATPINPCIFVNSDYVRPAPADLIRLELEAKVVPPSRRLRGRTYLSLNASTRVERITLLFTRVLVVTYPNENVKVVRDESIISASKFLLITAQLLQTSKEKRHYWITNPKLLYKFYHRLYYAHNMNEIWRVCEIVKTLGARRSSKFNALVKCKALKIFLSFILFKAFISPL